MQDKKDVKMSIPIKRVEKREDPQVVPQPVQGEPGLVQVDTTWGNIQPMQVAEGVRTVGEMEVIAHLEQGLPMVDSRTSDFYQRSTIPGAISIPHAEAAARIDELSREEPTVFICNGPQCGQSPTAIRSMLQTGFPPERILYYRGGLHDWLTLGLPVIPGERRAGE